MDFNIEELDATQVKTEKRRMAAFWIMLTLFYYELYG